MVDAEFPQVAPHGHIRRHAVAVSLGAQLAHQPFPSIDPQPSAVDVLVINNTLATLINDEVARSIVRDLYNLVCPILYLHQSRDLVSLAKIFIILEPIEDGSTRRHPLHLADLAKRDSVDHQLDHSGGQPGTIALLRSSHLGTSISSRHRRILDLSPDCTYRHGQHGAAVPRLGLSPPFGSPRARR